MHSCVHLEMETGDQRQSLHRQLFGGLLVALARAALDLGGTPKMFRLRESEQIDVQIKFFYSNLLFFK